MATTQRSEKYNKLWYEKHVLSTCSHSHPSSLSVSHTRETVNEATPNNFHNNIKTDLHKLNNRTL